MVAPAGRRSISMTWACLVIAGVLTTLADFRRGDGAIQLKGHPQPPRRRLAVLELDYGRGAWQRVPNGDEARSGQIARCDLVGRADRQRSLRRFSGGRGVSRHRL